jgi:gliding motility-associated-like protein
VDSLDVSIIEPAAFSLAMDSTNVTCKDLADGTATVTASGASGGYTYLWNDALAQNTATAVGIDAGAYQVIVSDANGCQDSLAVLIEEPDSLLLSLDDLTHVLCNGATSGSINLSTTGGTSAYSYLWSNGGGANEDLSNATAGVYTLTVTDANACTSQLSATITEPAALTINLAGTNILCFGGIDGEVDATVNGGVSPYTYGWTGPNGFTSAVEDINALSTGTHTLTVTDSNNCVMNESITITQPADVVITFSEDSVNCFGGNDGSLTAQVLTGGTAPFQFQWDAAANNQNTATATGLIAGTYMVTVTDGNGCAFTNSSTVTEPLVPLQIAVTGTDISCAGYNDGIASVAVTGGTAGYTYLWNDPQAQTTAQATNLSSNTYQVTVTNANGCTETGSVVIDEPTPIVVVATPDSANCWGDATGSITVEALGGTGVGYAYSLDGGETFQNSPNFLNLPAGVYDEIIVQDLGSNSICLSQLYTTTVYEQPYFTFEIIPGDTTLQLEESLTLELSVTSPNYVNNDIAQVSWFPTTGLNCNDCIDPTVLTYEHYTEYTATVYYYGGGDELCSATANTIIQVENSLLLFIPNAFTPGSYDDVNKTFEVFGEGIEFVTMEVYNRWGEKVFESSNQRVSWDGTYKGEMQGPGVYSYYVNVEYLDGKFIDRKGSVSILR